MKVSQGQAPPESPREEVILLCLVHLILTNALILTNYACKDPSST